MSKKQAVEDCLLFIFFFCSLLFRFALFNIMTGVFVERALTAAIPDSQKLSRANPVADPFVTDEKAQASGLILSNGGLLLY